MKPTLYAIGTIVKAFGIKGEVVVRPMTETPARFARLKRVYLGNDETDAKQTGMTCTSIEQRGVRVKLDVVPDRSAAEAVMGALLFVDETARIRPAKGSYFVHDIIGLNVVDETHGVIGRVKDVLKLPGQDIYVVARGGSDVMIPAVREFIRKIDIADGTIHVRLIEGMVEGQ